MQSHKCSEALPPARDIGPPVPSRRPPLTVNRRSLTPPTGLQGVLAQRRGSGGARREISARVTLRTGDAEYDGWALNISRGGIRVVIEGHVTLGQPCQVLGYNPEDPDAPARPARVVWMQDEPDGAVLGLAFLDEPPSAASSVPPSSPPAPSASPPGSSASAPSASPPPSDPPSKP